MHYRLNKLFELTLVTALLLFLHQTFGWAGTVGLFILLNVVSFAGLLFYASYVSLFGNNVDGRLVLPERSWIVVARRFWSYGAALALLGWVVLFIALAASL